jgi:perosamine synthetase
MLPFLGLGETLFDPHFSIKRMSAFQAGLAVRWEERLFGLISIRKKNAAYLLKASVKAPIGTEALLSGPVRFPIIVSDSAKKRVILHDSNRLGLGGADVYPDTIDGIAELSGCIVAGTSTKACSIVERMITVPVHPYVTEADMEKIADLVRESRGNVMRAAESMQNAGERNR